MTNKLYLTMLFTKSGLFSCLTHFVAKRQLLCYANFQNYRFSIRSKITMVKVKWINENPIVFSLWAHCNRKVRLSALSSLYVTNPGSAADPSTISDTRRLWAPVHKQLTAGMLMLRLFFILGIILHTILGF